MFYTLSSSDETIQFYLGKCMRFEQSFKPKVLMVISDCGLWTWEKYRYTGPIFANFHLLAYILGATLRE